MFKIRSYSFAMSIMATLFLLMFAWLFANQISTAQTAFDCSAVTEIPTSECNALVAFYNGTDGGNWPSWSNENWLQTTTPCSWVGVTCANGTVTEIDKRSSQLNGDIPAAIGDLPNLTTLYLRENQVTSVPAEIGNLSNLVYLNLELNQLTTLPEEIGQISNLEQLNVNFNQLSALPSTIGNLPLSELNVYDNQLTTIPPELWNLTALHTLNLGKNQLTSIPVEVAQLNNLTQLYLQENNLTDVPDEIWSLPNLTLLHLEYNQLNDISPAIEYGSKLSVLRLSGNQLIELPIEIGNLSALTVLFVGQNPLTSWPSTLTNLTNINSIDVDGLCKPNDPAVQTWINNMSNIWGSLTDTFCTGGSTPPPPVADFSCANVTEIPTIECSALVAIYDNNNGDNWIDEAKIGWLQSPLPCSWAGVTCTNGVVTQLTISYSGLSGDLPAELGNLSNLTDLVFAGSAITSLPAEIGNLSNLTLLDLHDSSLGTVPAELGNLTDLTELDLGNSNLTALPAEIGNLSNLSILQLYQNQLTTVPVEIGNLSNLSVLRLDVNELTSLPAEIGNLTNVWELGLSNNPLTQIPAEIGNMSSLSSLIMSDTSLTTLPAELGNLNALQGLLIDNIPLVAWPDSFVDLNVSVVYMENVCEPTQPELQAWLDSLNGATPGRGSAPCILTPPDPSGFSCATATGMPTSECDALVAIYNSMGGANWNVEEGADWLQTTTPCNWDGVVCNNGSVTQLALHQMGLSGAMPAEIGNLSNLRTLNIGDNRITSLPAEIGTLSNLEVLHMSDNPITSWPSSISNLLLLNFVLDNVCEPSDPALQTWLDAMPTGDFYIFADPLYESRTGVLCSEAAVAGKIWIEKDEIPATELGIPSPTFNPFFDEWLANVTVNLVDRTTGATFTTTTGSDGRYTFRDVPYGNYEVTVDESSLPAGRNAAHYAPHGPTLVTVLPDDLNTLGRDFVYSADEEIPLTVGGTQTGAEGGQGMVFLPFLVMAGATTAALRHANAQ